MSHFHIWHLLILLIFFSEIVQLDLTSEGSQSCVLLYATSRHGIVFERKWPVFHARLARFLFLSLLSLAIVVSMSFACDGDNFDDLIVSPTKKKQKTLHRSWMTTATTCSAMFYINASQKVLGTLALRRMRIEMCV